MKVMQPAVGIPTGWKEMRYAIVAALQVLGPPGDPDEGYYTSDIQFQIEQMFKQPGTSMDWDDRGSWWKAFDKAMGDLRERGIIIRRDANNIESRLAVWDQERY